MPEDGLNLSTPVIRRAIALLDDVFEEISDRARWSYRAFAADASGQPILGRVEDAVESERAVARCAFGSLLHQGLARGYRIEIAAVPYEEQNVTEVTRAPDSWMVAAVALARVGLDMLDEGERAPDVFTPEYEPTDEWGALGTLVLVSVVANDAGTWEDAVSMVALAAELLRAKLDRRADGEARTGAAS